MAEKNNYGVTSRHLRAGKFRRPQRAWKLLRSTFQPYEQSKRMRYVKVLGYGGFGLVQKWDLLNEDGSRQRSVAIKTLSEKRGSTARAAAMRREIFWAKRFAGSEHLVQLVDISDEVEKETGINSETSLSPIMVMEELGRGNLSLLIHQMKQMKYMNPQMERKGLEYVPNRVLWEIFLCLIRGCIGMAYPPFDYQSRKGLTIRESTKNIPLDYQKAARIVHSDIDPQNVIIGSAEDFPRRAEHFWNPPIKIADYGCMVEWDDRWDERTKLASIWGKHDYKAPEQFSPRCLRPRQMGSWTNVYQIGQVMHDLITQERITGDGRCRRQRLSGSAGFFDTYGWRMLDHLDYKIQHDWINVDFQLRELVALCMADRVEKRPELHDLEIRTLKRLDFLYREAAALREASKKGLNPVTPSFVPGQLIMLSDDTLYQRRLPYGQVEPDWLLHKFYSDYFISQWESPDKYEQYWSKEPLGSHSVGHS